MTEPVLFASYAGVLGGAERVLLDCVTRLERPLRVACPPGPLADELHAAGIDHVPLQDRGLAKSATGTLGLTYELTKLKPSTLVAWGAKAVMAVAAVPNTRRIAVHHDLFDSPALRGAVRATTKRSDVVVAASQAVADDLALEATILHPGVDLDVFVPTPLPDGPPKVLIAGALVPWKRPDLAVAIARRMPDARFTFAGEPLPGDPMPELDPPPNVTFAGRTDMHRALQEHHVLLHCADREPYGLVLVEALASGRPVVAPAAAGPLEILDRGLYTPGDVDEAVTKIREALEDPGDPRQRAVDVRDSVARLGAVLG
ncbi:glycosyltransferase family 4 protein [Solirubrobacter sp. CPCC 204708]|uniref:Glycosyltransferase family 4 protein n=1 Tax=Solirubrobacter deserti TaxID=2282478 RepID=A0ABT4RSG1_9ACTN|nr:glycosyltransferase family 4 protein [Solirubrobacter deserti]MBE2316387.1 glycosyltransferase family 4 protein [Solirubrobacter deserti]MDA0141533.1 glycosyltransferase family 4 protein [Solirubrobacter deserti]